MHDEKLFKKRDDLVISEQEERGRTYYVIKKSNVGDYYKLRGLEYSILMLFDGVSTVFEVYEKSKNFISGRELPYDVFISLLEKLKIYGFFENVGDNQKQRPFWDKVLHYRKSFWDPDLFLAKIVKTLGFVFTNAFILISFFVIMTGFGLIAVNFERFQDNLVVFFNVKGLITLYLSFVIFGFIHELGHAVTCKYFGGSVNEIGFLFLYFDPCFYVNVSDAWLFKDKVKRLWVGLSGVWLQLFIGALASIVWFLLPQGNIFSCVFLLISATCGLITFINLNPLIKLDGYYVLGDLLEISNLRGKSFNYLKEEIIRFFSLKKEIKKDPDKKDIHYKRGLKLSFIYNTYSLLSIIYSLFTFYIVARLIYNFVSSLV